MFWKIFIPYLIAINIFGIIICIYDKFASKKLTKHRIRERTLLLVSAMGASLSMFLCMLIIRHKTKHIKFMAGIPVIIILHIVAAYFLIKIL